MAFISKKNIIAAAQPKTVSHHVEAWGGDVGVRLLTMQERIQIEDVFMDGIEGEEGEKRVTNKDLQTLYAQVAVAALVDEKGETLFEKTEELYQLAGPVPTIIHDVFTVATGAEEPKKSNTDS